MKMSCQCFAEMLIHFRFGKFLALPVGPISSKVMPKFFVTTDGSNQFSCRAGNNGHHDEGKGRG